MMTRICTVHPAQGTGMSGHYDTLISVTTCMQYCTAPGWRLIDCRFDLNDNSWGAQAYRESHIPGAHYAHLEADLSGVAGDDGGRHPLPDWQDFADRLSRWGIHRDTQVVAYDQGSGTYAARLWWLLRAAGHPRVAVLDGGWTAWQAAGGRDTDAVPPTGSRPVDLSPGTGWVTTQQVERNLGSADFLLIDARSSERFAGLKEPIDPVAGHIPGALNFPFEQNLGPGGVFRRPEELRELWRGFLQGRAPAAVVHMCGSGITACHNLLAMEAAGLHGSRLYVGSWSEWIRSDRRPVATGSD
jgi:thiosulfate/3-mercaptopyruvate sulfurtransferase